MLLLPSPYTGVARCCSAATLVPPTAAGVVAVDHHAPPKPGVDWDSFGFRLNAQTDFMWLNRVVVDDDDEDEPSSFEAAADRYSSSSDECIAAFGTGIHLSPAATVLNYGQALFEGLKAFRRDDGTIVVFRPDRNARRMQDGARRFLLPPVPTDVFVGAVDAVVRENARWVPPAGKGALYLRPILVGSGADLGVKPSWEATFCVYCSPVGNYFKGGLKAIRLLAVRGFARAVRGGAGHVKASGNYAPAFMVQRQVKKRGYDEVLCLDAERGQAVEEAGASNFFAVYPNNTIVTPSLESATILPGVTRASIIELAENECGCTVVEGRIGLTDLEGASEAFCCGTGASVTPVGSVSLLCHPTNGEEAAAAACGEDGHREEIVALFGDGTTPGPITQRLYETLLKIQTGSDPALNERYRHWIHVVEP
jgi:branched-chain amino acid aminotransferase